MWTTINQPYFTYAWVHGTERDRLIITLNNILDSINNVKSTMVDDIDIARLNILESDIKKYIEEVEKNEGKD